MTARPGRRERGQALVEFAFVISIFLVVVFWIFEFGNLFRVQIELQNAVRDGARYAALNGCPSSSSVLQQIQRTASDLSTTTLTDYDQSACTTNCQTLPTSEVTVTGNYTYTPITPIGSLISSFPNVFNLYSSSEVHNEC